MRRRWQSARGFSVAEATVVLTTVSVLSAAAAPVVGDYVNSARESRANSEVRVVATAVLRLSSDLLSRADIPGGLGRVRALTSDGDIPAIGSGVDGSWNTQASGDQVGQLNDHLVTNGAGYAVAGPDLPAGIKGWRGPYLDRPLGADPWGRQYVVRMGQGTRPTIVLSAGVNGVIDTVERGKGLEATGDDIVTVLSSH